MYFMKRETYIMIFLCFCMMFHPILAAKFVDMLSAIGGTMGLLTGFSIISGVEILYFAAKIGWNIIQRNKSKMMK